MKRYSALLSAVILLLPFLSGCVTNGGSHAGAPGSDQEIRRDVSDALREDVVTASEPIGISVEGQIVTLHGLVSSPAVQARAVTITRAVPGIKGVVDKIAY
ncbi:MAG: BON domain-containing protein [Verrucomicrobiota bacterium]